VLIDVDDLDERWPAGIPSDWAGDLGRFDADDTNLAKNLILIAIQHLNDPIAIHNYDTSNSGIGEDFVVQQLSKMLVWMWMPSELCSKTV
jgi:hypothetical protein